MGFAWHPTSPPDPVSSYLTLSPLPAFAKLRQADFSLWHFPWGYPRWTLSSTMPCGARTFLSPVKGSGHLVCFGQTWGSGTFPLSLRWPAGLLVRRTYRYASAQSLGRLDLAKNCHFQIFELLLHFTAQHKLQMQGAPGLSNEA